MVGTSIDASTTAPYQKEGARLMAWHAYLYRCAHLNGYLAAGEEMNARWDRPFAYQVYDRCYMKSLQDDNGTAVLRFTRTEHTLVKACVLTAG